MPKDCKPSTYAVVGTDGVIRYGFRCATCNKPRFGVTKDVVFRNKAVAQHVRAA